MPLIIHAQLDDDTAKLRDELQKQLGWSDSQIICEGINSLATLVRKKKASMPLSVWANLNPGSMT